MKLYKTQTGEIVGTQALAGKGFTAIEVPVDKQGLIAWLNENLPAPMADLLGLDEGPIERTAREIEDYQSPMTARTVIASIDAGMCASAIRQMEGPNLAKVVGAAIERMADLAEVVPVEEDLLG